MSPKSISTQPYFIEVIVPHPRWRLESCVPHVKTAHDIMERLQIIANPSKERVHDVMNRYAISPKPCFLSIPQFLCEDS